MIPDLGKYAGTVLSAYGATIFLLVALVGLSLWRGRKLRAQMQALEEKEARDG